MKIVLKSPTNPLHVEKKTYKKWLGNLPQIEDLKRSYFCSKIVFCTSNIRV